MDWDWNLTERSTEIGISATGEFFTISIFSCVTLLDVRAITRLCILQCPLFWKLCTRKQKERVLSRTYTQLLTHIQAPDFCLAEKCGKETSALWRKMRTNTWSWNPSVSVCGTKIIAPVQLNETYTSWHKSYYDSKTRLALFLCVYWYGVIFQVKSKLLYLLVLFFLSSQQKAM